MQLLPKRLWLVVVLLASMIAISAPATASASADSERLGPPVCNGHYVTAKEFTPFSKAVWKEGPLGSKGASEKAIAAQRKKLKCAAGDGHRIAMQKRWRSDKKSFYKNREKLKRLFINYTWDGSVYPSSSWFTLPKLKPYVAAALAEAAGDYTGTNMPGWTMMQVSLGEGALRPGSRSADDGWGWLAITRPHADGYGVYKLGGYEAMLNPVKNAYIASLMYGDRGISPWYGTGHVTCTSCHYHGKFDIRDALGGLTYVQALRRAK